MGKKADRKGERRGRGGTLVAGRKPPSQALPSVDSAAELRRGLDAFRSDDFDAATAAWRKARRAFAADAASRVDRAVAEALFRRAGRAPSPTDAIRDLEEAARLAPGRAIYRYYLGLAYCRQGQTRRGVAALEEAVRLEPADDRFRYHLALAIASAAKPGAEGSADRARARDLLALGQTLAASAVRLASVVDLIDGRTTEAIATLGTVADRSHATSLVLGLAYLRWHAEAPAPGRLAMAVTTFERIRRARSKDPLVATLAAVGLAETQMASGNLPAAGKTLGSLRPEDLSDEPSVAAAFADANRQLGYAFASAGDLEGAVDAWRLAGVAQAGDSRAARGLAHLLEVAGTQAARAEDFHKAYRYWSQALDAEPDDPLRLQRNLALVAERLERFEEAARLWEGLIRQWRKSDLRQKDGQGRRRLAAAYRHLAQSYEEIDEPAEAARALERALQGDVADSAEAVEIRERLSRLYRELEQPNKAIEHLKRLLADRPKDVRLLLDIGGAYQYKHDYARALEHYERARAVEPDSPAVREALASAHDGSGHRLVESKLFDKAIDEYRQAVELEPGDASHWIGLGEAWIGMKRTDEAEAAFRQADRLEPRSWMNEFAIGTAYLRASDLPAADRHFRRMVRFAPRKSNAAGAVALLLVRRRAFAEAEPYLTRVLKSRDAVTITVIANQLLEQKEYTTAITYLERLIAVSRDQEILVEARLMLATALAMGPRDHARAAEELTLARDLARGQGDLATVATIEETQQVNEELAARQARAEEARRRNPGA